MERLFARNETENNEIVSKLFIGIFIFVLFVWMLCWCGVFDFDIQVASIFLCISAIFLLTPYVFIYVFYLNSKGMKYILILNLSLCIGVCYYIFTFQMVIMLILPFLVAMLYMNKRLLYFSGAINFIIVVAAHFVSALFVLQPLLEPFIGIKDVIRFDLIPRIMQLGICFVLLLVMMNRMLAYMQQLKCVNEELMNEVSLTNKNHSGDRKELEGYLSCLTDREKEIFIQMLQGNTNMQIAERLCLSSGTVKNYVSAVYDKIGMKERNYLILKFGHIIADYDQSNEKK